MKEKTFHPKKSHFSSEKCSGNVQLKLNNMFTEQIVHLRH